MKTYIVIDKFSKKELQNLFIQQQYHIDKLNYLKDNIMMVTKKKTERGQLLIRLPQDLRQTLEAKAEKDKRSLTLQIEWMLEDYERIYSELLKVKSENEKLKAKLLN